MTFAQELPDSRGRFGDFGGRFVPETLMPAVHELEVAYRESKYDEQFQSDLDHLLKSFVGRPTELYKASNLSEGLGGATIYIKREDLAHTGAHKINNAVGQGLLAKRMGKKRIIAETGAGQHGVATATVCSQLGLECVVYMGEEDIHRQALNVFRMKLLGAEVRSVKSGSQTLKDAINEAIRDWVTNVETTYYLIGSVVGPHPYPQIVRDFQRVIGQEARSQILSQVGRLPKVVVACVGGGSNAMGAFFPFLEDKVQLHAVEAAGYGLTSGKHALSLGDGSEGVLHGMRTYILQDEDGQIKSTHSVSAGLDYPGVGPELSFLKDEGRIKLAGVEDDGAIKGFETLSRNEGIIPALESAHAIAYSIKLSKELTNDSLIVINLSGRGDKDVEVVAAHLGERI